MKPPPNVPRAITGAIEDVLGWTYASVTAAKRKDGTRVWRVTGRGYTSPIWLGRDGKVYKKNPDDKDSPLVVVDEGDEILRRDESQPARDWVPKHVFRILSRDPDELARELEEAVAPLPLVFKVGRGGGGNAYDDTIIATLRKDDAADAREQLIERGLADAGVRAVAAIVGALLPLDQAARRRVLDYVLARLQAEEAG